MNKDSEQLQIDKLKQKTWHLSHGPRQTMKIQLQEIADYLGNEMEDTYGNGEYLQKFEKELAEMFGKESALFLISGTLALQTALRIWCDRKHNYRVAFHPKCHIEMAQYNGYNVIHGIKRVQFSAPERLFNRLITLDDFKNLKESIAAIVIELPQRHLAQLPTFDELQRLSHWCRTNEIALILDGARIWESKKYLDYSLQEIASLFDTVYVSFYKGLNNLAGCALIGDRNLINEAKVWQRRIGAGLKTQFPYVVSAKKALAENLMKVDQYVDLAGELASIFEQLSHFTVTPYPVQTNMFNVIIDQTVNKVLSAVKLIAKNRGVWLLNPVPSFVDRYSQAEITVGDNVLLHPLDEIREYLTELNSLLNI